MVIQNYSMPCSNTIQWQPGKYERVLLNIEPFLNDYAPIRTWELIVMQ